MAERGMWPSLISGGVVCAAVVLFLSAHGWPYPGPMVCGGIAGAVVTIGVWSAIDAW